MGEEVILGISIRRRMPYDVIEPEDFNNKKQILLRILDEIDRIAREVGGVSEDVEEKMNKIREEVNALPAVSYGDYVLHDHHNNIVSILKDISELLQVLPVEKEVIFSIVSLEVRRGATVEIVKTPQTNLTHEETIS